MWAEQEVHAAMTLTLRSVGARRAPRALPLVAALAGLLAVPAVGHAKRGEAKAEGDGGAMFPKPEPSVLVQGWATVMDQDVDPLLDPAGYGDPEDDVGFKLRRARIGMGGKSDTIRYDLQFGYTSGFDQVRPPTSSSIQLIQGDVAYRPIKGLWVTGGYTVVPVSRDFLIGAGDLVLGERAVGSQWMIPQRDMGVMIDGRLGEGGDGFRGRLRAGAFNGNQRLTGDDNPGKLVSVRAEGMVGPGDTYETWGKVDGFTMGAAGSFWHNANLSTDETAFSGDVIIRVAGLAVLGEFISSTIKPTDSDISAPGVLEDTPRVGTIAQVGYSVWRLEPAVRWSSFDDHAELTDNGDVGILEGGVTWHGPKDVVRAGAVYVSRLELSAGEGATQIDNDSARLWFQLRI